jgi:hypothetical protein
LLGAAQNIVSASPTLFLRPKYVKHFFRFISKNLKPSTTPEKMAEPGLEKYDLIEVFVLKNPSYSFTIETQGREVLLDITSDIAKRVRDSGIQNGMLRAIPLRMSRPALWDRRCRC